MTSLAGICNAPVCDREAKFKGYCGGHYQRLAKGNPIDTPIRGVTRKFCIVPGCVGKTKAQNLCSSHYQALLYSKAKHCRVPGCQAPELAVQLCSRHYQLTTKYCVTGEWLEENLGGPCSICGITGVTLHIDHDHACCNTGDSGKRSCGKCVRGALCKDCNMGLGAFRDDTTRMRNAIAYLLGNT